MSDGLCMCGCGSSAVIAKRTRPDLGYVAGQPTRYARGHNRLTSQSAIWFFDGRRWYVRGRDGRKYYWYRILIENELGRALTTSEDVHHVNGDPTDDRVENLQVTSRREHHAIHRDRGDYPAQRRSRGVTKETRPCAVCSTPVSRWPSQFKAVTFCSVACKGIGGSKRLYRSRPKKAAA